MDWIIHPKPKKDETANKLIQAKFTQARYFPTDIPFKDAKGKKRTIDDFKNKMVVLNFWATWCMPCAVEMPSFDELQAYFDAENIPAEVVAVSQDFKGISKVKSFYKTAGIKNLDVYIDERNRFFRALRIVGLPTTIVISGSGKELIRYAGPLNWSHPEIKKFLRGLAESQ